MKIIILFGDFGVGKTFISNIIKSQYTNVYSINIYDFISFRLFKCLYNEELLESNPYIDFLTYINVFKEYKIKEFIKNNYKKFASIDDLIDYIYGKELNSTNRKYINSINIQSYIEFFSSDEFKEIIYNTTRTITDDLRNCGLQHNYIEYLLSNDFLNFIGWGYKMFNIIIYYGYSIKEFELLNKKFKNNIVFIENTNLSHTYFVKNDKKLEVMLSDEYRNKMEYIKNNCKKRLVNNLDLKDDLSNKLRSLLSEIKDL